MEYAPCRSHRAIPLRPMSMLGARRCPTGVAMSVVLRFGHLLYVSGTCLPFGDLEWSSSSTLPWRMPAWQEPSGFDSTVPNEQSGLPDPFSAPPVPNGFQHLRFGKHIKPRNLAHPLCTSSHSLLASPTYGAVAQEAGKRTEASTRRRDSSSVREEARDLQVHAAPSRDYRAEHHDRFT